MGKLFDVLNMVEKNGSDKKISSRNASKRRRPREGAKLRKRKNTELENNNTPIERKTRRRSDVGKIKRQETTQSKGQLAQGDSDDMRNVIENDESNTELPETIIQKSVNVIYQKENENSIGGNNKCEIKQDYIEDTKPTPLPKPTGQDDYDTHHLRGVHVGKEHSIIEEYFKIIRSQMLKRMKKRNQRTILVTSTYPGEGKSFFVSNIAASIALGFDDHVLLVDTDFRKPVQQKIVDRENCIGLSDFLSGNEKDFKKLIIKTDIPKLSVICAGKSLENPTYMLSSALMGKLIKHMRSRYKDRIIIFDCPPVGIAETIALSQHVDGVIIVAHKKKASIKTLEDTIEEVGKNKIVGLVLNGYKEERGSVYTAYNAYYKK